MDCTETLYLESAQDLKEQCDRYGAIIKALGELVLNDSVSKEGIKEYWLDDGQVKIKTQYRSVLDIADSIEKYRRLRNICLNKLNGRATVLRPWQGFRC